MSRTKSYDISKKVVWNAYLHVKKKKGAPGVDEISVETFEENLKDNLYKIWNRMSSGTYFASPVKEVLIPKPDGRMRGLGVPTVSERIAQTVVKMYLEPIVEPILHSDSYGYRPGKSALDAVGTARKRCWEYKWCIDIDIKGFFDNLDWDLVIKAIDKHTDTKWILLYIKRWLEAPIEKTDGTFVERTKGTPQGSCISPLIINIFMHHAFDNWMKEKYPRIAFERYSDDILVHCRSEKQAKFILQMIKRRLKMCKLELNPTKTRIVYCGTKSEEINCENISFTFLGYSFQPRLANDGNNRIFVSFLPAISNQASKNIKNIIRGWKLHRYTNKTLEEIAKETNPIVQGWVNYYGKFYKSHLNNTLIQIERRLYRWTQRKYKKLKNHKRKARKFIGNYAKRNPGLFVHWKLGITSSSTE